MNANVIWQGGLKFSGSGDSGFNLQLGPEQEGFRPMELFAIALAGCTAMDVVSILEKKRQEVTGFEVKVHADRAPEHPKVFTHARIEYLITGRAIDAAAVIRSIDLSATRYCPAQAMFEKVFPIELEYSVYEDLGDNERKLMFGGFHTPVREADEG